LLTGFNTDVEYGGVVYHVQTEDKGLQTPIILSLVYTGGAILASKRSPYDDLIARGFDEGVLAQRLSRQHKLICAAVHAGRIEELKRMGEREPAARAQQNAEVGKVPISKEPPPAAVSQTKAVVKEDSHMPPNAEPSFARWEPAEDEQALKVTLLDDGELRSGESVTFRVMVSRPSGNGRQPVSKARIVVKTLGTSFRPTSKLAATNAEGLAMVPVLLPSFESGRAAVLIQANAAGEKGELRRIILPAKPR
jgi:hypothetical protein